MDLYSLPLQSHGSEVDASVIFFLNDGTYQSKRVCMNYSSVYRGVTSVFTF